MDYNLFDISATIGLAAFTISGILVGVRKELDWLGVVVLGTITAIGGGILRDILINKVPNALQNSRPVCIIITVIITTFIFRLHRKNDLEQRLIFIVSDSIGLVSFSITGAIIGIDNHLDCFGVMGLAFATAVGGGILRDLLVNEIPLILKNDFYATVSLIIAITLYVLNKFAMLNNVSITITYIVGLSLRLIAYFNKWRLPKA